MLSVEWIEKELQIGLHVNASLQEIKDTSEMELTEVDLLYSQCAIHLSYSNA